MLVELSLDQALIKAKSHLEKNEILEAQKLYQTVLDSFPENIPAQKGLAILKKSQQAYVTQSLNQETINHLINLYNQGQFDDVVKQLQILTKQYPQAFILWNILGAANKRLGQVVKASEAFKKVTELNPNYADGFNNLGVSLKDQGKLDDAIEAYNKALSIKPDYAVTYLNLGMTLKDQGKLDEAIDSYNKAISIKPDYAEAYNNVGVAFKDQGKVEEALLAYDKALSLKENYTEAFNNMGNAFIDQGKIDKGIEAYDKALSLNPNYADAYNNMGVALQGQGKLEKAIEFYYKALLIKPDYAEAYHNMGNALKDQSELEKAIEAYNKALSLKPNYAEAYNNLGLTLQDLCKFNEAIEAYDRALSLNPDYAEAYNNLGIAFQNQNKIEEAIECYNKAVVLKPNFAEAHNNLGISLKNQGKLDEAIDSYNKALLLMPDYADAYNNMGNAFKYKGKLNKAIESYNNAISIKPNYAKGFINLGAAFKYQGKLDEAIEAYNKALSLKPDYIEAYHNLGNAFTDQGKQDEAIEAYEKALSLKPDYEAARVQKLYQQANICDWHSIEKDRKLIPSLGISEKHINPLAILSLEDAPKRHYMRSKIYAKNNFPEKPMSFPTKTLKKSERIRIGYFSSDFVSHPVAYLIAKVIEIHNRDKFDIFAYSLIGSKDDELRKRLTKSFDVFKDVSGISDKEVAVLCRQDNIDIAIDLNGYTRNSRSSIFAYRAAPIQINFLGFPGTMGADFIDYIIADKYLIPPNNSKYFTEKQLYLPNTYMPTDNSREFSNRLISRSDMGLPDKAFVFCCFNNNYKISDLEFDIWMRLLSKVKGSVLWLRRSNQLSDKNIIKAAKKRNICASRIVFADKLPMKEHLTRHKLADLFIDTFSFNAHTTASEALWSGLPVVTKQGQGFAARVAASLLNAIGLPELITENDHDYESLILELATNPNKLFQIKEKLAANRLSQPLFDTELYTKHLEIGYQTAYQNYCDGKVPETIIVPN